MTISRPGAERPLSMKLRCRWVVPARRASSSWLIRRDARRSFSAAEKSTHPSCSRSGHPGAIPCRELPARTAVRKMARMDDIDLGVLIPIGQAQWGAGTDPRELLDFAVRAEELGYSSLWVNDFLLTPRIEALTMLAAVAPLTSRVTLGTAALLPVLRRPVQAAQALASIDLLSGGRLVLTVGAAFPGQFGVPQHALSDVPWEHRFTR